MALFEIKGGFGKGCKYTLVFDDVKRELVKFNVDENTTGKKMVIKITDPVDLTTNIDSKVSQSVDLQTKVAYKPETITKGKMEITFPSGISMRCYLGV